MPDRCDTCETIYGGFNNVHEGVDRAMHRITETQLSDSVDRQCSFCTFLFFAVTHCVPSEERPGGKLRWSSGTIHRLLWEGRSGAWISLQVFTLPDTPRPWSNFPVASIPPGNTRSERSFRWTTNMLHKCTQNHQKCGPGLACPMPRRILRISADLSVKLVETQHQSAQYVCLSHRWNDHTLQTTKALISSFQEKGIPGTRLPRLFQDAIAFTQRLHIRFIWIDSLCIVQDDALDWRIESAKMAAYYQNSYLTLVANKPASLTGGLYSHLQAKHHVSCFDFRNSYDEDVQVYVRQELHHFENYPWENSEFPLFCRAWAYQERLLAPRVIHFTQNEIIWECREATSCQCAHTESIGLKMNFSNAWNTTSTETQLQEAWLKVVEDFSPLHHTFGKDKLPALSGLAQIMGQLRKNDDQYLAGLWRSSLLSDCLWSVNMLDIRPRPREWRAPTWSWASTNSKVDYHRLDPVENLIRHARLVEANIIPASRNNPTGEVSSGYLEINGELLERTLKYTPLNRAKIGRSYRKYGPFNYKLGDGVYFYPDYALGEEGPNYVPNGSKVYCLRMVQDMDCDLYLVLRRMFVNVYERIGLAELKNTNQSAADLHQPIGRPIETVRII